MPAIAYAMSDHAPSKDGERTGHLSLSPALGGCGAQHEALVDDRGRVYYECDRCAPAAIAHLYGFAATPHGVPLTPDEIADRELAEREATSNQNTLMRTMTESFVKAIQSGGMLPGAPKPKTLAEQLAELSEEERAQVAAMLAPKPAAPAVPAADEGGEEEKPGPAAKAAAPKANRTPQRRAAAR
jgi:hypothetical protein